MRHGCKQDYNYKNNYITYSWRGFNTQELATRGSLWGGYKGIKPETNSTGERNTPLPAAGKAAGYFILYNSQNRHLPKKSYFDLGE